MCNIVRVLCVRVCVCHVVIVSVLCVNSSCVRVCVSLCVCVSVLVYVVCSMCVYVCVRVQTMCAIGRYGVVNLSIQTENAERECVCVWVHLCASIRGLL